MCDALRTAVIWASHMFQTICRAALVGQQHYASMPVQYTAIFHGCKNDNFQIFFGDIFLIFAQNIDCGYTFEPHQRGGSNEYPQSMFWSKNKKNMYTRVNPIFSI